MERIDLYLTFNKLQENGLLSEAYLRFIKNIRVGARIAFGRKDEANNSISEVQIEDTVCSVVEQSFVDSVWCESDGFIIRNNLVDKYYYILDIVAYPIRPEIRVQLTLCELQCNDVVDTSIMPNYKSHVENTVQRMQSNIGFYMKDIRDTLFSMLVKGNSPWYVHDKSEYYYSVIVSMYLNTKALKQVLFVDFSTMKHLQYLNDFQESVLIQDRKADYIHAWEEIPGEDSYPEISVKIPKTKNRYEVPETMGLFMRVQDEELLNHLFRRIPVMYPELGNYIFICPTSIEAFSKHIWNSTEHSKIGDMARMNRIQGCTTSMDLLFKLIFLHEVGHMVFMNPSTRRKRENDETLANWIASMSVTKFEREVIEMITEHQSEAYRQYITLPEYSIHNTKIGEIVSSTLYNKKIRELLGE